MKKNWMKRLSALTAVAGIAMSGNAYADDVKIGMITTLSGGGSYLGIEVKNGFELAIELADAQGIELIIKDDARKPDVAKSIADEMIQRDKVDIMTGIIWLNLAMAVVPSTVRQGVFYISPNAGPSQLAGRGCHENYFNASWQNNSLPAAMGIYMKEQGIKKPFILAPNYPAGKDVLAGFKSEFGDDVAAELYTKLGQTDYAAEIAQIRASGADSVFFFLPGGMGIAFMKQYAGAGVDIPIYGPSFSFDEIILGAVGDAALGVVNSSQWAYDLDNEANKRFVEAYRAKFDGANPTFYASQGYDTANLILSALQKASPEDKDAFREALRAADFESVRGPFSFGSNQHPVQNIYVREVVAGAAQPTNKYVGLLVEGHTDAYAAQCEM